MFWQLPSKRIVFKVIDFLNYENARYSEKHGEEYTNISTPWFKKINMETIKAPDCISIFPVPK